MGALLPFDACDCLAVWNWKLLHCGLRETNSEASAGPNQAIKDRARPFGSFTTFASYALILALLFVGPNSSLISARCREYLEQWSCPGPGPGPEASFSKLFWKKFHSRPKAHVSPRWRMVAVQKAWYMWTNCRVPLGSNGGFLPPEQKGGKVAEAGGGWWWEEPPALTTPLTSSSSCNQGSFEALLQ